MILQLKNELIYIKKNPIHMNDQSEMQNLFYLFYNGFKSIRVVHG
jgi:hypothetical protein